MTLQADMKGQKETLLYYQKCKNSVWILKVILVFEIVAPVSTSAARRLMRHLPPRILEGQLHYTMTKFTWDFVMRVIKQTANLREQTPDRAVMTEENKEREKKRGKWKCSCQHHHFKCKSQKLRIQWIHFGLKIELTNQQSTWISFSVQHHLHCSAKTKKKSCLLIFLNSHFCCTKTVLNKQMTQVACFYCYGTLTPTPQQYLWTEL